MKQADVIVNTLECVNATFQKGSVKGDGGEFALNVDCCTTSSRVKSLNFK